VRLILASASPRRRALLERLGLPFEVRPSAVPERLETGVPARALARALALDKARDVAARLPPGAPAVVLGADTLVVLDGRPFGKPGSRSAARAMLTALAGRVHEVVTGVALVATGSGREAVETVVSRVAMHPYDAAAIEAYVETGESDDKAGAYAVQGEGGRLVAGVDGCYTNVVGLPLRTTARLLRAFGLPASEPADGLTAPGGSDPGGCVPS
jgi:septum formation protein